MSENEKEKSEQISTNIDSNTTAFDAQSDASTKQGDTTTLNSATANESTEAGTSTDTTAIEKSKTPKKHKSVEEKLYSDDNIGITTYKCPNCGGDAVFDARAQKMHCLYCGSFFEIKNEEKVVEKDLSELLSTAKVWDEAEVYQCSTCGAKEILDKQEVASVCPFCGTRNIVKIEELPGLKPQGVVPFKVDKEKASKISTNWARRKYYAPRAFKKSALPENLHGVYNPVFTFDLETRSTYNGKLGKNYTTTHIINGRPVTQVHTRYFNVSGTQDVNFDDYIVQATSNMSTADIKAISPFPTNGAPAYRPEYLRGYSASTYNKDGAKCYDECKDLIKTDIERQILRRYDYDVKSYLDVKTAILKQKYKYILVPVYVGHYRYKGKLYNFYINGDTGKITGKTPISPWKVLLTVLVCLAIVAGIVALSILFGD